jgi:hypothetical protein
MIRTSMLPAILACLVIVALPLMPVRADLIVSSEAGVQGVADPVSEAPIQASPAEAPAGDRVGAFLSGEEWWEIPLGAAFMVAAGWGIYHFAVQND